MAAKCRMQYLQGDYVHITEEHMPIQFQKLLQDLELESRNGMVVTSALLRGINLRHRQTQLYMTGPYAAAATAYATAA